MDIRYLNLINKIVLLSLIIFCCCNSIKEYVQPRQLYSNNVDTLHLLNYEDTMINPGIYFLQSDTDYISRKLFNSEQSYYIGQPIVQLQNFKTVEFIPIKNGSNPKLKISFDKTGKKKWNEYRLKNKGRFGLIAKNNLVYVSPESLSKLTNFVLLGEFEYSDNLQFINELLKSEINNTNGIYLQLNFEN